MKTAENVDYLVLDVEGNGQHPPDLVELAIVPVHGGQIGTARSWLLRPTRPITGLARRIHGIGNHDIADAPTIDEVRDDIRAAFDLAHDLPSGLAPHRATYDAIVTARLFTRLSPMTGPAGAGRLF